MDAGTKERSFSSLNRIGADMDQLPFERTVHGIIIGRDLDQRLCPGVITGGKSGNGGFDPLTSQPKRVEQTRAADKLLKKLLPPGWSHPPDKVCIKAPLTATPQNSRRAKSPQDNQ